MKHAKGNHGTCRTCMTCLGHFHMFWSMWTGEWDASPRLWWALQPAVPSDIVARWRHVIPKSGAGGMILLPWRLRCYFWPLPYFGGCFDFFGGQFYGQVRSSWHAFSHGNMTQQEHEEGTQQDQQVPDSWELQEIPRRQVMYDDRPVFNDSAVESFLILLVGNLGTPWVKSFSSVSHCGW